jgi:hypothetical protein
LAACATTPKDGGRPAETVYRNIDVLRGRPAREVDVSMKAWSRALGVGCEHCHVKGQWHLGDKPAYATARSMFRMVEDLNAGGLAGTGGVACWTCHAGRTKPSRLPQPALTVERGRWPAALAQASDRVKLAMSVYDVTLGVGCEHCHTLGDWHSDAKPAFRMVSRMTALFDVFPKYMPSEARTQCWMCHKGSTAPKRAP